MRARRALALAVFGAVVAAGIVSPSIPGASPAHASGFALSSPGSSTATPSQNHDPGDFVISGYAVTDSLLVSIGFIGAPAGTTFSLNQTTGLTPAAGYSSTWTGLDRVSFISTQADANAALASITVVAGSTIGDFQLRVSATLNEDGLVYNPKNDHFYKYVSDAKTWAQALAYAPTLEKKGATGYLATITSAEESLFIAENVTTATQLWVAGAQVKGDVVGSTATDSVWKWVAGPENGTTFWTKPASGTGGQVTVDGVTVYSNWCANEPNNASEPYVVIRWQATGNTECWNDWGASGQTTGFIVEFDSTGLQSGYEDVLTSTTTITVNYPITNPAVERGNAQATVSWTAPSSGTVTGYTVTAVPGGQSCTATGTQTFCTVVGLTNGTEYVFDIVATFDGTTATSVARTPAVTPIDSAPGLTGPASIASTVDTAVTVGDFTVSDPFTCGWGEMTATMTASSGTVSAEASGSATVAGSGTSILTVRGSSTDVAATISGATYSSSEVGNHTITTEVVPSVDFIAPDSKRYHLNRSNGHYYRVLTASEFSANGTSETQQNQAAEFARGLSFCGFRGYLVAVDDAAEQTFIETSGAFDAINPKISLYSSGRLVNSVWQWRPGNASPAGQYPKNFYDQGTTAGSGPWHSGEPNNSGSTHAFWYTPSVNGTYGWDDIGGSPVNYGALVEFGATTSFSQPQVTTSVTVSNDPTDLAIATAPVLGANGAVMTVQPVIDINNASGVRVSSATNPVTVSIASGTGGTLRGTLTVNAVNGVATFSGLSLQGTIGQTYVLRFESAGLQDVQTTGLTIVPPPAPNPRPNNGSQNTNNGSEPATSEPTGRNTPQGLPPGRTPTPTTPPPPLAGPLPSPSLGNGGQAPQAPTALVGGAITTVSTNVVNQNQVNLQTGSATFGVSIPQGQGSVASQGGNTELAVQSGGFTTLSGSGLFPGSTVQVFLPFGNNDSRELGQLTVDSTGSFSGEANFVTRPTDPPLPIGRHVLQIASLNAAGERVIVEMAVTISQPLPSPELNRESGAIPDLAPGQSFATRAGLPIEVNVTADPDNTSTTVEGDGWAFSVNMPGSGNSVQETPDGGALITVAQDGEASVSGTGFMPGTRADVWVFSDPTLIGSIEVNENGDINGVVAFDGRIIPAGDHTLQIQGVGPDGFVLAANLGVMVTNGDTPASDTATTQENSLTLLWWVLAGIIVLILIVSLVWWRVSRRSQFG